MDVLGLLSGVTSIAMLLSAGLWVGMLVYVVARWRTYREAQAADPQLGLKTVLSLFQVVAFQLALYGAFTFFWALFTSEGSEGRGALLREAFALLVPAGLVYGAHFVALQRTNAAALPLVPRMFAGVSLVVTGLIGFAALVALFKGLFAKGEAGEPLRRSLAAVLVYPITWAFQGLQFYKRVGGDAFARPVPPPAVPPP
jgi:hypothetical protein